VVLRAEILATIATRRLLEDDPGIGASIERRILERELAELETAELREVNNDSARRF
jgi:hypothetical protein